MWPFKQKYKSEDVFDALKSYIDHVGCSEGVTFLSGAQDSFDPKHWEILQDALKKVDEYYIKNRRYIPNYIRK